MNDPRYSKEVLALALARESAAALRRATLDPDNRVTEYVRRLQTAFDVLDNQGVFSPVDRQTDYMAAADVLASNAADRTGASPTGLAFSQIRHPSDRPAPGQGFTQDQARALFGDTDVSDSPRGTVGLPRDVEAGLKDVLDASDRKAEGRLGRRAFGIPDKDEDGRF